MEAMEGNGSTKPFSFDNYDQRITIATAMIIFTIIGTIGNTLVIVAVILSRRLRSPTNWFIVNLAFADFFACLTFPFNAVAMLSRTGWPLPDWICTLCAAMFYICLGASVLTLVAIAFNRYYLLTKPIAQFRKLFIPRNIVFMMTASWAYPSILVFVPYSAGVVKLGYSEKYKSCSQDNLFLSRIPGFHSLLTGAGVLFPASFVIVVIYARIYFFVSKHASAMSKTRRSAKINLEMSSSKFSSIKLTSTTDALSHSTWESSTSQAIEASNATAGDIESSRKVPTESKCENGSKIPYKPGADLLKVPSKIPRKSERVKKESRIDRYQVTVINRLAVVIIAFFICVLPCAISCILPHTDPAAPWTSLLKTFNSCINPLIYARTMPEFRRVMRAIVRCRFHEIPEPISCIRRQN
nr:probable G-protein coupled receptor No18 [Lytechinus pictus]